MSEADRITTSYPLVGARSDCDEVLAVPAALKLLSDVTHNANIAQLATPPSTVPIAILSESDKVRKLEIDTGNRSMGNKVVGDFTRTSYHRLSHNDRTSTICGSGSTILDLNGTLLTRAPHS